MRGFMQFGIVFQSHRELKFPYFGLTQDGAKPPFVEVARVTPPFVEARVDFSESVLPVFVQASIAAPRSSRATKKQDAS